MKILNKYLIRMLVFLALIITFFIYVSEKIKIFYLTNMTLNGVIVVLLVFGIILMFRQVLILFPEIEWLNSFIGLNKKISVKSPKLLKPMYEIMKSQTGKLMLSQVGMRSILESIESRLIEQRETSRYFIGLLIFLGLLGTFWGLLGTINSVSTTITNLNFSQESEKLFSLLKEGLEKPLGGMGTAFSSSLFGLGGSLVLGFFDLQCGQAQNRFYNEIEEKLALFTKVSSGKVQGIQSDFAPAYIESLIESTTENLKKSSKGIEQQNANQEEIMKSLLEMNQFLQNNINTNKEVVDELKILSKTIANTLKKD